MKFPIKGFFNRNDQIRSFLRIWSHLLEKLLMENFIFCVVTNVKYYSEYPRGAVRAAEETQIEI